jgi:uncharacterized membrane protein
MSAATILFLVLRAAHVLIAALWIGGVALSTFYIFPALEEAGPAAGPVMGALMRRKLPVYMASLGGTAVLTGFYLYYRFTGGFDPSLSATRAARVFGAGGAAGLLALIIGGAIVSRNANKISDIAGRLASARDTERPDLMAQLAAARRRAATGSRIVIALQVIAIVLMAIGHYV